MGMKLGPCKLIWHYTNKQMVFDFMPDRTELIFEVEEKSCDMRLECKFFNINYGEEVAKQFKKLLKKGIKPRPMSLIPNYGFASKKDSMLFHRVHPLSIKALEMIFSILPTKGTREFARHGLKKI